MLLFINSDYYDLFQCWYFKLFAFRIFPLMYNICLYIILYRLLVGATTYTGATNNRGGWGTIPARRTF